MERYQCHRCPGSTRTLTELRCHLRTHDAASCRHCQRHFGHRHFLLRHVRLRLCRRLKRKRLRRQVKPNSTEASEASEAFQKVKNCTDQHMWSEADDQTSIANSDLIMITTEVGLAVQMQSKAKTPAFQCDECPKAFAERRSLEEHVCAHQTGPRVRCPRCKVTLSSEKNFEIHRKSSGCERLQEVLRCEACSIRFRRRHDLVRHTARGACVGDKGLCKREPKDVKPEPSSGTEGSDKLATQEFLTCPKCQKALFKKRVDLLRHLRVSVSCGERSSRRFCAKCGRHFAAQATLDQHSKVSQSCGRREERLLCEHCPYTCPQRGQLTKHMAGHGFVRAETGLKRETDESYVGSDPCSRCGRRFRSPKGLRIHQGLKTCS